MKEELITFETAKLAKEKGFNFPGNICSNIYTEDGSLYYDLSIPVQKENQLTFKAPTQSLLHKWLRKTYNILICVYSNASGYLWEITDAEGGTSRYHSDYQGDDEASGTFTTYEKAYEHALIFSLKSL